MSLKFVFSSTDGSSTKSFDDILELEEHFGKSLAHSNVSDDGVVSIKPLNEQSDSALRNYRMASIYGEINFDTLQLPIPLEQEVLNKLETELRKSIVVELGAGRFAMRGHESISAGLSALCDSDQSMGAPQQCRENCVVYVDNDSQVLYFEDLLGQARTIGDLVERKMVESPGAVLTYASFSNEDQPFRYSVSVAGYCVGPEKLVENALVGAFERYAEHLKGDTSDDSCPLGFKTHLVNEEHLYQRIGVTSPENRQVEALVITSDAPEMKAAVRNKKN